MDQNSLYNHPTEYQEPLNNTSKNAHSPTDGKISEKGSEKSLHTKRQNDFDSVKNYAPSDIQEEQNLSDLSDNSSIDGQNTELEPVELKLKLEEVQEEEKSHQSP